MRKNNTGEETVKKIKMMVENEGEVINGTKSEIQSWVKCCLHNAIASLVKSGFPESMIDMVIKRTLEAMELGLKPAYDRWDNEFIEIEVASRTIETAVRKFRDRFRPDFPAIIRIEKEFIGCLRPDKKSYSTIYPGLYVVLENRKDCDFEIIGNNGNNKVNSSIR